MKKVSLLLVFVLLFTLSACSTKDFINAKFYFSNDADTIAYEIISIQNETMIDDVKYHMERLNNIKIDNLWLQDKTFYIDLNAREKDNFNRGSYAGTISTCILLETFFSFPNVKKVRILVDGEYNIWAEHFDFRMPFDKKDSYCDWITVVEP